MTPDPIAGRPLGAPAQSRMIIATQDGVFLWPGIALTRGKDEGFESLGANELANLIGHFYGPQAISLPIRTALRRAAAHLESGHVEKAQHAIDALHLPPISPNGRRLMRAIAERQGLALPDVPLASGQSGTVWNAGFVDTFARTYDDTRDSAQRLAKLFDLNSTRNEPLRSCECAGKQVVGRSSPAREERPFDKANFNPYEPRDERGRWTIGGASGSPVIPAQETIVAPRPLIPELTRPIPRPIPLPGDQPVPYTIRPLENPFPDNEICVEEWAHAREFCGKLLEKGLLGKGDYRNMGKTYRQCLLGQVSEACGGNPVA